VLLLEHVAYETIAFAQIQNSGIAGDDSSRVLAAVLQNR